jgi:hypothetical protein
MLTVRLTLPGRVWLAKHAVLVHRPMRDALDRAFEVASLLCVTPPVLPSEVCLLHGDQPGVPKRRWVSRFKPDSEEDEPDAHEYVTGAGLDDKRADYEAMSSVLH